MSSWGSSWGRAWGAAWGLIAPAPEAEDDAGRARRWQPAPALPWWWFQTAAPRKVIADGAAISIGVEVIPGEAAVTTYTPRASSTLRLLLIGGEAAGDAIAPGAMITLG